MTAMPRPAAPEADLPLARHNVALTAPDGTPPTDAPSWIWEVDHPYLHGVFAPVATEMRADDLPVTGELPSDLCGAYVLNTPNQRFKPNFRYHYYDGDSMLHALYIRDGKASYACRWVHTFAYDAETEAGRNVWPGLAGPYDFSLPHSPIKDNSNTDVIFYNGKLLTLWYMAGVPYRIDPDTLETMGPEDFGGRLKHTLSAHSKVDPATGELLFFNYGNEPPYMSYGIADPSGQLVHEVPVEVPGPRSPHDLGVTTNYVILHDLPLFHDVDLLHKHNRRVLTFHRELPARFGILPRRGAADEIRWFEADPCYILHILNCWEEGDWVVMDACRQPNPEIAPDPADGPLGSMMAYRRRVHVLHRWRFNMRTGETREEQLDDLNTEFPMTNQLYLGRKSRYAYHQYIPLPREGSLEGRCQLFDALVKYDTETGARQIWDYGDGVYGNESPFAPRVGATGDDAEDDGYVVTFSVDSNTWKSEGLIFDARDIEQGPIARVALPRRVPEGFHSTWVPGEDLWPS